MKKGKGFLTTWGMEADHVLLASESWRKRTEVGSVQEEF